MAIIPLTDPAWAISDDDGARYLVIGFDSEDGSVYLDHVAEPIPLQEFVQNYELEET